MSHEAAWQSIRAARDFAMYLQAAIVLIGLAWSPAVSLFYRRWPRMAGALVLGGVLLWLSSLVLLMCHAISGV